MLYRFENFVLDTDRCELRRDEALLPIEPQVFDLLAFLVGNRDRVVSKDDLLNSVWDGRIVSESTLASRLNAVRRVIGDSGEQQRLIRTIFGKGIRFIGVVQEQFVDGKVLPASSSPHAPRLSIVVLPFSNLGDDREQQYFADGITEDLTTELSRIAGMLVISRNTAFTYRNKAIDTKQIGRELGVRYVLEGSVRRSADQIRINAQLIDAVTDAHLWAERFEGGTSDLFALQDEITRRIAFALNVELARAEAARPTQHPDTVDYIFRGRAAIRGGPPSRERYAEGIALFEHALALDPQSVEAKCQLASNLASRVIDNMTDTAAVDLVRAEGLAGQALAAAPRNGVAHNAKGQVLRAQRRYAEAILEYEMAISSNFNPVYGSHGIAHCKVFTGSIEEAIPLEEQAIRLSPRDAFVGVFYRQIGLVHVLQSRTNEAVVWLEKARYASPTHPNIRAQLASAYALAGEPERAAAELAEARRLSGDNRFSSLARLREVEDFGELIPKVRALFEATYIAGLRKAGMPEE